MAKVLGVLVVELLAWALAKAYREIRENPDHNYLARFEEIDGKIVSDDGSCDPIER